MTTLQFSLFRFYWKISQIEKMQRLMQMNHLCYFSYVSCLVSHQLPFFYMQWSMECSRDSTYFCYSCRNVMHFFKPNPFASTYACLILCFLIFVVCLLHLVNFVMSSLKCTFWNHMPSFIKLIGNLHPITLLKTFPPPTIFSHKCQVVE